MKTSEYPEVFKIEVNGIAPHLNVSRIAVLLSYLKKEDFNITLQNLSAMLFSEIEYYKELIEIHMMQEHRGYYAYFDENDNLFFLEAGIKC